MNLAHFVFLLGLLVSSIGMVVVIMLFTQQSPWTSRAVRFFGCCACLSLALIWIGFLCKLVESIFK